MKNNKVPSLSKSNIFLLNQIETWLEIEAADGDSSPNTKRSYLSRIKSFLSWCDTSNLSADFASEGDIKNYRTYLIKYGYRRATIAAKITGVRRFYDALCSLSLRNDNPADNVRAKADPTSKTDRIISKYIPDREAFLTLYRLPNAKSVIGTRDQAMLRTLCYAGLRVSELCALNLEDIQLDEFPSLIIRAGKGRKRRHIPLDKEDVHILSFWLIARATLARVDESALFISLDNRSKGSRISSRGARKVVDKYLGMANLKQPGRSCHALRHSTATWPLAAGAPMEVIADLLGHSSVAVTAIYAKVVNHRKYTPSKILTRKIKELLQPYLISPQEYAIPLR